MTKEPRKYHKWYWEKWTATCRRMNLEHSLSPYTKINSKRIKGLDVRLDIIKLLEENTGRTLFDINHSSIFLHLPPKRSHAFWEDALEGEMATHSSILAWKILWTEEPGRPQSIMLQRIGHYRAIKHTQTQFTDWSGGCPLYCRMFSIIGDRWPTRCQYFFAPQVMIIQMLPDIARGGMSKSALVENHWVYISAEVQPKQSPGIASGWTTSANEER